ncbi:MAG: hypothetical protein ICV59_00375 [Thermoleophilia bacterium]|nr:hypothetical protein [Thermoleophilia bacterium]
MTLAPRRPLLALGVTAAVALVVLMVAVRQGWWDEEPIVATDERISVSAVVTPRSHMFGDPLTARLELVFSRTFIAPATVRVRARFRPFRVEQLARSRSDHGDSTRLSFVYRLSCLTAECLAAGAQRTFEFPAAVVAYALPGFGGPTSEEVQWPTVTAASRMSEADTEQPSLRATLRPLPEATYRVDPGVVGALALAGALLLVLVATALVVPQLPRALGIRRPAWLRRQARPLTPLAHALVRLRAASANGGGDERRALENLALELSRTGRDDLARSARRLAWSPGRPGGAALGDLSVAVERVVEETR